MKIYKITIKLKETLGVSEYKITAKDEREAVKLLINEEFLGADIDIINIEKLN